MLRAANRDVAPDNNDYDSGPPAQHFAAVRVLSGELPFAKVTVTTTVTQIFKTSDSQHFSCEVGYLPSVWTSDPALCSLSRSLGAPQPQSLWLMTST